jgi:hypothetical protein
VAVINALLRSTAKDSKPGEICVWAELAPALEQSRHRYKPRYSGNQRQEKWYGLNDKPLPMIDARRLDRALRLAAAEPHYSEPRFIDRVPKPLTIMRGRVTPARCLLEFENMERYHVDYQAYFTQPAFANGYAFVEEQGLVHGTNPGPLLHVLRRQGGRWVEVASQSWIGD